ncbi:MAG: hypothetical protein KKD77_22305 [Gammaproteobacteria bacterium]|nr:hypothetical protein [Gammaproteobacteria bacterium]MBU2249497.1 hypothetical protein [Gammaproteobacteria bacterium]
MAKKRFLDIDKLLFDTEIVNELSTKGIIIYMMLWGNADDWGGIELNPKSLSLRMGALKTTTQEVEKVISCLVNGLKKIIPYEVNGKRYGWIKNFLKHQKLNNPALPTIPTPEWIHFTVETYGSGKKYANYVVITEKLPVEYQYSTSTVPVIEIRYDKRRYDTTQELLEYYSLKTGFRMALTKSRREMMYRRLEEGYTPEQVKTAIDNFSQDDWEDRHKYLDLHYCIGTKDKVNLLDKWINFQPKTTKTTQKPRILTELLKHENDRPIPPSAK